MIVFLWCIYLLAGVTRLSWWLFFRMRASVQPLSFPQTPSSSQGISVIVCAHNNSEGLKKLLPVLSHQDYPLFEIIIVNDRSRDETEPWLKEQQQVLLNLKVVTISQTPDNWNPKKYALTQGIRAASHPLLALTDSDCVPLSNQWLKHIAFQLSQPGKDICLGYSPYAEQPGLLNKIIQTETFFTALQYFSLANAGHAYMGVGRNLAYKKSFVEKHLDSFPFQHHLGGDDDLLINQLSTGKDAATTTDSDSFVLTFPPQNLSSWWKQKRRHLSAGIQYKPFTKTILAIYWLSATLFWLLFLALLPIYIGEGCFTPLAVHLSFFALGTGILFPLFRIFKAVRLIRLFLFWDFLYIASSSIIGFSTFLVKNKKWN